MPARERSVDLFGDEKRLDRLRSSQLFGPGRLTLDALRCFEVPPPLTWEPGPPGAPRRLLVLENLHTYDSFRRWNAASAAYAGVAYGQGNQFLRAAADLPRLVRELGLDHVAYFGDLDRRGLSIPAVAAAMLRPTTELLPAAGFYRLLLDRADDHLAGRAASAAPISVGDEIAWLPEDLRERARAILTRGLRLPQELLGWELLQASGSPFE